MIEKKIFYLIDSLCLSNKEKRIARINYLKEDSQTFNKQNLTKIFHKNKK